MSDSLTQTASPSVTLNVAPAQTVRGENILPEAAQRIAHLGQRPFLVAGDRTHPQPRQRRNRTPPHSKPAYPIDPLLRSRL